MKWSGSGKHKCVHGVLTHDGLQLFRVHDRFNSKQFTSFIQQVHQKFGKVLIVMAKTASHHQRW